MVQNETNLVVADNSGAKKVRVFRLEGSGNKKRATIGDIVMCAVKEAVPHGHVKKSDIVRGIIIRTKHAINRRDGSTIRFDDNALVIIDENNAPVGSRVFGPVARELREKGEGFMKIISLAPEVL